ncbi:MAG: 50S ribosomal protein L18 [Patescibacteria group bacterium]
MRIQRHNRIRARLQGTSERPRVAVFRSNQYISAQIIDDSAHKTLASAKGPKAKPDAVAQELAKKAVAAGISKVVFDRGGHKYHGGVKALAEGLRKGGLQL